MRRGISEATDNSMHMAIHTVYGKTHRGLTEQGDGAEEEIDNAQKVVPHWVDGREFFPVRVNHVLDVVRNKISDRHTFGKAEAIAAS